MREIFSDEARFQAWLDVEAALARAQARLGLIPEEAAQKITAAAKVENIDVAAMTEHFKANGFPILPIVKQLNNALDEDTRRYAHWGSTTQDITDTGQALMIKNGLAHLDQMLETIEDTLIALSEKHRDTVMVARTMGNQAIPITFGHKTAIWLGEFHRHRQRLAEARPRIEVGQIAGAVGTNATLGDQGLEVLSETMTELGLGEASISWHVSRDRWAEAAFLLGLVAGTCAKIGAEIGLLMRTEIAEVSEAYEPGRGGSSTLPQKRNPVTCPTVVATGRLVREKVGLALDCMVAQHERDIGGGHLEWTLLPEAFVLTGGALEKTIEMLNGLVVDAERMRQNLDLTNGLVMSEAVMMGIAPVIGRDEAHHLLQEACGECIDNDRQLADVLAEHPLISEKLGKDDIAVLLDPANYLGTAPEMVDRTIKLVRESR
ncbi:MAG: 3-carboxy-cis,cis-muconate cycloisomerase [Rhodospirillaceae bacterium]|nr:3-carboxy-cis,cis-muconate cycloisomerase [Rhodospirillaceae bacterium]HAA91681.1 3-carboxy-cis,cis-muconate cycloisomerase [Rhodospirillaceae bacterium]